MLVRNTKYEASRRMSSAKGAISVHEIEELAFDSIADLTSGGLHREAAGTNASSSWTGTRTMQELYDAVQNGSEKWTKEMFNMLGQLELPEGLKHPELLRKRKRRRADHGNELDIHAVYQGRMDRAWDTTEHIELETQSNKLVHLSVNLGASAGVHAEDALWRAAATLRIYEALIAMGRSVAITAYYVSNGLWYGQPAVGMVSVKLKDYGDTMDVNKLAALMTLGFMRVYVMRNGSNRHPTRTCTSGKGYPIDDYKIRCWDASEDEKRGGHVVTIGACFCRSDAQAVVQKFVDQYVNDAQVEGLNMQTRQYLKKA